MNGLNQNMQNKKKIAQEKKHEFAFYCHDVSMLTRNEPGDITFISDELYHRFKHVVRIKPGEHVILFDKEHTISFLFLRCEGKNKIVGIWKDKKINSQISPMITFILPLLKIDALSDAVYSLTEVGITNIQLVSTQKTQTPCTPKLLEKLERVAIAAAEQSKDFSYPTILPPVELADWLKIPTVGKKFHFDVTGVPFSSWYSQINPQENYYLLVGPEGDLTDDEKQLAKKAGFVTCLLTPTVLRSTRTISLVSGLFRL